MLQLRMGRLAHVLSIASGLALAATAVLAYLLVNWDYLATAPEYVTVLKWVVPLIASLIVAILALALIFAGAWAYRRYDVPAWFTRPTATPTPLPTPVVLEKPTYTVELGTVVETLEFTGRASPVQEQELFFETGGNVSAVNVARGDWVKAGDVLAELEVDDLEMLFGDQAPRDLPQIQQE